MAESLKYDVVVIGCGIAGAAAALAARARKQSVAVIAESVGATAISSGAWDLGPLPPAPISSGVSYESARGDARWAAARDVLIDGLELAPAAEVGAALESLRESLRDDLEITLALDRALVLPTSAGAWKRTFAAQAIQASAELGNLVGKRVALVASRQWRFPSELVAESWRASAARAGCEVRIEPLWLELRGADWPLPQLAARLVHDARFADLFREKLRGALEVSPCDILLFPPLFLRPAYAEDLGRELKVTVAECLATTEPIAGKRLHDALMKALERAEVRVLRSGQLVAEVSRGTVQVLRAGPAGATELRAGRYVLATGKGLGGGIAVGFDRLRETVFDLPLFLSRNAPRLRLRRELPGKGASWTRLGVWVDGGWRPIDETGRPVLTNVVACGSIVGGADFAALGLGAGFMAYCGSQCGKSV